LDIEVGVFGSVRRLGYVEVGGFVGVIWGEADVKDDCRCVCISLTPL
jgi:hypothetical protein